MRLDVEGCANTFKLFEGAPEQLDDELCVIKERFLVGVLGFFRRRLSSSSSFLRPRFDGSVGGGLLDAISSFSW
jgi:hypothetical protein